MCIFLLLLKSSKMIRRQRVRMNYQERKAVSPVIATVILVAVAITVSVGVSYWMGGISSQYTQFEKIEVQTGFATAVAGGWDVTMTVKNSGSADATITHVFVNDVPVTNLAASAVVAGETGADVPATGLGLTAGEAGTVMVYISSSYGSLSAGTTVNIKLHSAGGMDYIKLIKLP
jgi:archaeal type IV pilus assembly protein PilA